MSYNADHMYGQPLPSEIVAAPIRGFRAFDVEPLFSLTGEHEWQLASTFASHVYEPVPPEGPHPRAFCTNYDPEQASDVQFIQSFVLPKVDWTSEQVNVTLSTSPTSGSVAVWTSSSGRGGYLTTSSTSIPATDWTHHPSVQSREDAESLLARLKQQKVDEAVEHRKHVPVAWCSCGYWVCKTIEGVGTAIGSCFSLPGRIRVVAEVEGWGRIVEHTDGWRCEYMRIVGLRCIVVARSSVDDRMRQAVASLEQRYGMPCPIVVGLQQNLYAGKSPKRPQSPLDWAVWACAWLSLGIITLAVGDALIRFLF